MKWLTKSLLLLTVLAFCGQAVLLAQDNSTKSSNTTLQTAPAPQSAPYRAVKEIAAPRRWDDSDQKVELLYFFWYGCPTCLMIDQMVTDMAEKLPEGVRFQRLPAAFQENSDWQNHAQLFWALQNMGLEQGLHSKIFAAVQPGGASGGHGDVQLLSVESQIAFARANQIKPEDYENSIKSPLTYNMMQKTFDYLDKIDLNSVPAFIVNGRYIVSIESRRPITDFILEADRLAREELSKSASRK